MVKLDLYFPDTHNLKTLDIVDISSYPANFKIINPFIEITPPNFTKVNLNFHTSALNIYNSNLLGLSCSACDYLDLPDGIWTVKYTISPAAENFVERTFLRINSLKRKLEEVFMHIDITECDTDVKWDKMQVINQIELYVEGAIAAANRCNNSLAMKLYSIANKTITNLLKQC